MINTEETPKKYHYGLRTIMELFDIGPTVAITVLSMTFIIVIAGIIAFIRSAPPSQVTLTSGPDGSSFHRIGLRYAKILAKSGVKVNVLTSNGSLQNLERISDPKSNVELAIVQGGIINENDKLDELVSLGGISNQPILFFYRGGSVVERLSQMKGKTIAIGLPGSGTRKLALKLLDLNGIKEKDLGATTLVEMDADDAAEALSQQKIDGAFIMSENASGEDVRKLLRSQEIKLMNFKQAAAYSRKIDYLNVFELPEGVMDFGANIPDQDVSLVGPIVELVALKTLHPALSDLVLDAAMTIHSRPNLFQKRGEFPTPVEHKIKLSDDANRFYKSGKTFLYRYLPFWLASLLSRILVVFVPMAVILIPTIRSIPALFRWKSQLRIRRRYRELLLLEEKFRFETDPNRIAILRTNFDRIENEISQMKVRAAFADQFYILRGHIDYVRGLIKKKAA